MISKGQKIYEGIMIANAVLLGITLAIQAAEAIARVSKNICPCQKIDWDKELEDFDAEQAVKDCACSES